MMEAKKRRRRKGLLHNNERRRAASAARSLVGSAGIESTNYGLDSADCLTRKRAMKCPHCTFGIHESWSNSTVTKKGESTTWRLRIMTCPECQKDILCFGRAQNNLQHAMPTEWTQFYPQGSNRGPVPPEVPAPIANDYQEAALVLLFSPKASAALSRRCLQAVLRNAGYVQRDLAVQIDAVLNETDPKKVLPTGVHNTLDAIRNFGNFSAHTITDLTTLQIIDVQGYEAEYCLDILDAIFDHYYVRPKEAMRRRAALDEKLLAAGKPTSK
jgi:Domain of unknown function (DUF4145)